MFKYLKRLDPRWPVEVAVADVGHSRAQNKPETWHRLNQQAWQWLESNIDRSREQETTVSSEATVCADQGAPQHVVGRFPEDLANSALTLDYPPGGTDSVLAAGDLNGEATDAIAGEIVQPGETCRHSSGPAVGGYTQYSPPFQSTKTYVGLGHVRIPYVWTGGVSGMLAARLFDAGPDGKELLMTRGVYRFEDEPQVGEIRLPLYGNHWRIEPGHRIRLDLTQVDTPTYRPSNFPTKFDFPRGVTLVLPTR
jgi:hypothetical protein